MQKNEQNSPERLLKVAALIDLPRTPFSGGHVRGWENLARAAANSPLPLDLTVYFSGEDFSENWGERVHIRHLPPVFSSSRLKFLPYMPDYTDLAPYHPRLAKELKEYDVVHTTDGFFAFARTAERVRRRFGVPVTNSFHTDTPSYARIFTRTAIQGMFGNGAFSRWLTDGLRLPERQGRAMERRLAKHLSFCSKALANRELDKALAASVIGRENVGRMRRGIDREIFDPRRRDREGLEARYGIPAGRIIFLFVGRVDVGKNIQVLAEALKRLVDEGLPLHLITAGRGPAEDEVRQMLGTNATVLGQVEPDELGRLYAGADALALSSEVEVYSLACLEAMASGCPALASEKSGVTSVLGETPALMMVASGADNWTNALRSFASSPELRNKMREAAELCGRTKITDWHGVLAEDLFPAWRAAYAEAEGGPQRLRRD